MPGGFRGGDSELEDLEPGCQAADSEALAGVADVGPMQEDAGPEDGWGGRRGWGWGFPVAVGLRWGWVGRWLGLSLWWWAWGGGYGGWGGGYPYSYANYDSCWVWDGYQYANVCY